MSKRPPKARTVTFFDEKSEKRPRPLRKPRGAMKAADRNITVREARENLKEIAARLSRHVNGSALAHQLFIRPALANYFIHGINKYLAAIEDDSKGADLGRALGLVQDGKPTGGADDATRQIAMEMRKYWKGVDRNTGHHKWKNRQVMPEKLGYSMRQLDAIWKKHWAVVCIEAQTEKAKKRLATWKEIRANKK